MKQEENNTLLKKINVIYQKQLGIYKNILKLTEEQKLLCAGDPDKEKVLKLINSRLQLINNIEKSNPELNGYKNSLINNLLINEFRIGLIKEKFQSHLVEDLSETLRVLGITIKKINDLDNEIRHFYANDEKQELNKGASNPQRVHQAYKVFLEGAKMNQGRDKDTNKEIKN